MYGEGNAYTADFWEYDPRLGRRFNIDPVTNESESPYACFRNNPIANVDIHGDESESSNASEVQKNGDPPKEVVIIGERPKKSFFGKLWSKTVDVASAVADYVPVVGGIKHAVQSAMVGDWRGAAIGLGEAVVDGVLLVTTGGIGNIAKAGIKGGVKLTAKILAKEIGENFAAEQAGDGLSKLGVPGYIQIAAGVLLGVHGKPGKSGGKMGTNIKANKMFDDVVKAAKIQDKHSFSDFLHKEKSRLGKGGADNFSWKELKDLTNKYFDQGGK